MTDEIARAYLVPAQTKSLPGAPGSPLNFSAGLCRIRDPRLVTIALRRADVTVHLDERYSTHAQDWIKACGDNYPAKAKVALADGTVLFPPNYIHPDDEVAKLYEPDDEG